MRVVMRVLVGVASRARAFRRIHRMSVRVRSTRAPLGRLFVCFCVFVSVCACVCLLRRFPTFARVGRMEYSRVPLSRVLWQMTSVASAPNVHVIAVEGCAGFSVQRECRASTP